MMMFMKNFNILATSAVCFTVGFLSHGDVEQQVSTPQGGAASGSDLKLASFDLPGMDAEQYFDCLADTPNECSNESIPEASGCHQWQSCVDVCKIETDDRSCVTQCSIDHLEINSSSLTSSTCDCGVCLKACDEICDCGT
jgi:hypothetical protein